MFMFMFLSYISNLLLEATSKRFILNVLKIELN